ncbi:MAG: tartrate dehydrogenase [Proteobacteria bacterium]|mgnify:FL=1|nr:tartrate dehydrogenase [Pseudomonadota bacterium]MDA1135862.1 tartrate dehydrogenase [Pseudomonadota bacterium]
MYKIAVIPGDGIGPEVINSGVEVLKALSKTEPNLNMDFTTFDWGGDYFRKNGEMMPESGVEQLKEYDTIYFGSAGDPNIPDHITLWGLRLKICQGLDQYANLRPVKLLPGITSPLRDISEKDIDWSFIRENSEGEYSGIGGRSHKGYSHDTSMDIALFTRKGVERIQKFAFEIARSRPRKLLTLVTKSNAQRHGMVMWDEIFEEVSQDYRDVTTDKMLVDAMTTRMVLDPKSIDTVVASNLHADILTDLAASLSGSMGIAPTGNLDPDKRHPSMFEPIHGSAFDIMGKGIANPIGSYWSSVMMLESLGEISASKRLMSAIEKLTSEKKILPKDLGGSSTSREITDAMINIILGKNY